MTVRAEIMEAGRSKVGELGQIETQCKGLGGYSLDDVPHYQCLGVAAMPYQASDGNTDSAEAIVLTGVASQDGVIVGMRDCRTAKIVGTMRPGDTVLHSTGPNQAAQLQLREEARQASLISKSKRTGKHFGVFLDGEADTLTVNCGKHGTIHISPADGMVLTDQTGKASIQLVDGKVIIMGQVILGGRVPSAPVLSGAPPGIQTPGVFVGA